MKRINVCMVAVAACMQVFSTQAQEKEEFDGTIEQKDMRLMHRGGTGTYGTALSKLANFVSLNGYADFDYLHEEDGENTFSQSAVNLFVTAELSDKITTEFNVGFQKEEVEIEYAFLDYKFSEKAIVRVGKFLLPTSDFNEYTSLSYMNRAIFNPLTVVVSPSEWSSVGLQLRGKFGDEDSNVRPYYGLYVVNGLASPAGAEEEEEEEGGIMSQLVEAGEVEDNNENKGFGGQFGIEYKKNLFASLSYHTSKYDSASELGANVAGASVGFDNEKVYLAAEYHVTNLEESNTETEELSGFFVTGAYKLKKFEPVLRYDNIKIEDETVSRYTVGVNYYLRKTGLIKLNYSLQSTEEENESLIGAAIAFTF
jgi:hypothetical protein